MPPNYLSREQASIRFKFNTWHNRAIESQGPHFSILFNLHGWHYQSTGAHGYRTLFCLTSSVPRQLLVPGIAVVPVLVEPNGTRDTPLVALAIRSLNLPLETELGYG